MSDLAPLVISGAPRSGTTLLYNLFDGHPDINWLVTEGYIFEYLFDLMDVDPAILVSASRRDLTGVLEGIRDRDVLPPLHIPVSHDASKGSVVESHYEVSWSESVYRDILSSHRAHTPEQLWRNYIAASVAGLGDVPRRFACLKAPDYAKSASSATRLIDSARAIVIVRNPFFAIDSLKKSRLMRGVKLLSWPTLALVVGEYLRILRRVGECPVHRVKVLKYEDLVRDTEKNMQDIAAWLDIDFDKCLTTPTVLGESWFGASAFRPAQGVDSAMSDRPLETLTGPDIDLIKQYLQPFLQHFEYSCPP
jgi:hypothetical protein